MNFRLLKIYIIGINISFGPFAIKIVYNPFYKKTI
jgi:hypothetical protein